MLSDSARIWARQFLLSVATRANRLGLTPNRVSAVGFIFTLCSALLIGLGKFQWAGLLLLATSWFDAVDGTLARMTEHVTPFGAFWDATLDRFAETFIYLAILWRYLQTGNQTMILLTYLTVTGSVIVSYTRAKAESVGIECRGGILTRFERMGILIVALIFARVDWALWLMAPLAYFTALQRVFITWQGSQHHDLEKNVRQAK